MSTVTTTSNAPTLEAEWPVEPGFTMPTDLEMTADALARKMAESSYEFEQANRELRKIEDDRVYREKQVRLILLAKQFMMLTDKGLRERMDACFVDPKFKFTEASLDAAVFIELAPLMTAYNRFERIAKQAQKEFDMYAAQAIFLSAKWKHENIDHTATGIGVSA